MSDFFVFSPSGIQFKAFPDLRLSLEEGWRRTFGSDINLSPTSPDGHHVDLEARTIRSVAEAMEVLTTMLNRDQAVGYFLDVLATIAGVRRFAGESDQSLRQRIYASDKQSLATYTGMLTYLQNTLGPDISLSINDGSSVEYDMELGSIRVIVPATNASTDDEIASAIWFCKPAGIRTVGNSLGIVVDRAGKSRVVHFSRPFDTMFDVRVRVSLYSEENFPSNGNEIISGQIRDWSLGEGKFSEPAFFPGTDVIPQRFLVPILSAVPGILDAKVFVKKSSSDDWMDGVIQVQPEEKAVINDIAVEVI